ncbi:PAS domain S-box protein [Allochromatium palmeri]|uniref:Sensor protein FixL n=1 Tax=Allochromatium palmeri TaxID=231048 RepID=A0A6N8EAV6_9GAMM|nr:PAS domain S-box protein [Allochromatium palmeri]MTW19776.1 PAS domain S-box protein [Allochromatium palmeri]
MPHLPQPTLNRSTTILATLGLALLAVLGNLPAMPLAFGVVFIFGSVFAMLAVVVLGPLPAMLVGLAGGLYTWVLWGHPYAMLIMMLEPLVVGLLYWRGRINLVLADMAFWLVLGAPLVILFYSQFIGLPWSAVLQIALKQPLNGIFNALLAGLLVIGVRLLWPRFRVPGSLRMGDLIFHLVLVAILLAGSLPLVYKSYQQRAELEERLRIELAGILDHLALRLERNASEGHLDLDEGMARERLRPEMGLAVTDAAGEILAKRGQVNSLDAVEGRLIESSAELRVWMPGGELPLMKRWKQGRYRLTAPVAVAGLSQVVVEAPAAPLVAALEAGSVTLFGFLVLLLLIGISVAALLSHWLSRPLRELGILGERLAEMVAQGLEPRLPNNPLREYNDLAMRLQSMAHSLAASFSDLRVTQAGLEEQVELRTQQLERLSQVARQTTNGVIITDTEGRVQWTNEAFTRISGYPVDEMLGRKPGEILQGPQTDPDTIARIRAAVAVQQPFSENILNYTRAGEPYWISIDCNPLTDADGQVYGFIAIESDITAQKRAEDALQLSNLRLRSLFELSPLGIALNDMASGDFIEVNDALIAPTGYSREEFLALSYWDLTPKAYADQEQAQLASLKSTGRYGPYEKEYIRKDGRRYPVLLNGVTIEDPGGTRIWSIVQDISERKRAEQAIRDQAQQTQAIVDNIVDGLITIDCEGTIASANPAALRIFDYASEEVIGENVGMLMPEPQGRAHDSYMRHYLTTGVARVVGFNREMEGRRRDGTVFPIELAVSEVSCQDQPMYIGMVRDITERKRVERMKSEFVSTVSHELRTPLTSISGSLGLLLGGAMGELPATMRPLLEIAHKNSQRLNYLINDLLDMEKIAAGKMQFNMQETALMPLVEQAVSANQSYGEACGVRLELTERIAEEITVRVDSQRLQQVLANFLSNAAKFSPEGGTVEVGVRRRGTNARIWVRDHGPGIPREFHSRIFEKFSQADASDSRQRGGTGLGLAITKELMARMGGAVGFESVFGEGATFWAELPIMTRGWAGTEPVPDSDRPSDERPVLVVEDDPDVAQLLSLMLTQAGYRSRIATSGEEALRSLAEADVAAMTLDLQLPGIHGLEVIRRVRQNPRTAELPIIVISASMAEGQLTIDGDLSFVEWLPKPLDDQRLVSALAQVLPDERTDPPRILHIEDDLDLHYVIKAMVGHRYRFDHAATLAEARALLAGTEYDLTILDLNLPDGSGWELLPLIRRQSSQPQILILSSMEVSRSEAEQVEAVLLKSQITPKTLLDALGGRIRRQQEALS